MGITLAQVSRVQIPGSSPGEERRRRRCVDVVVVHVVDDVKLVMVDTQGERPPGASTEGVALGGRTRSRSGQAPSQTSKQVALSTGASVVNSSPGFKSQQNGRDEDD